MKSIKFVKMQGAGNDFVLLDGPSVRLSSNDISLLAKKMCDRRFGVGADGILLCARSSAAEARMRIFNADGSEPDMCGNGVRCFAFYLAKKRNKKKFSIETKAGLLKAHVRGENIRLNMTEPKDLRSAIPLEIEGVSYKADYLNTGVPHVVVSVDNLDSLDVKKIGRLIRNHAQFQPAGTNVNFIEIQDSRHVKIRTYERGVEDETLACGTGSVASAILAVWNAAQAQPQQGIEYKIGVETKSGEPLTVYFKVSGRSIIDVWLEGKARIVFKGEYYV